MTQDQAVSEHVKFGYPDTPSNYRVGDKVLCHFFSEEDNRVVEDFGEVVDFISPDRYVIKLHTHKGFASVPVENIRKAGTA